MRKLHVGGKIPAAGWEILNAQPGPHVDHLGNANDLSRFEDGTFDRIYASHVLEHMDYQRELLATLEEWHRVLVPGGVLMASVPDLDTLARLLLDKSLDSAGRFQVMRMIFGGHTDEYDYHVVGLNEEILGYFLETAGFVDLRRVGDFGLFNDSSAGEFAGVRISLNVTAEKPA